MLDREGVGRAEDMAIIGSEDHVREQLDRYDRPGVTEISVCSSAERRPGPDSELPGKPPLTTGGQPTGQDVESLIRCCSVAADTTPWCMKSRTTAASSSGTSEGTKWPTRLNTCNVALGRRR
jgi:hypothetical protein